MRALIGQLPAGKMSAVADPAAGHRRTTGGSVMATMKGAVVREAGGADVLKIETLPVPEPGP
ncbi:hypothetical protein F8B43_0859 [Methylorubrum populi]|uniref:Uncharacterized protein n=1 Tax=Methylorubrum populi TaxID=223967 RepID=A0A833N3U1_9HYPH|nr:hypothetical protein F8B43_0859 [Methylorubrum populi]